MVSERDIQEDINWINEFRNNVIRSMSFRIKISQNRIRAIRILEQNHQDPNGITLLRRCIRNERRFLRVVENGLKESREKLLEYFTWIDKNIKDKEAKRKTRRLVEIVNIFYSKLESVNHRLELEEKFIEIQDKDSFKNFVKQWNKEIKLNRTLLKKTVDTSELESYFKKLKTMLSSAPRTLKWGAAAGGFGAFIQTFFFVPNTKAEFFDSGAILDATLMFAFFAIMVSLYEELHNLEKAIEQINIEELDKAKRSI